MDETGESRSVDWLDEYWPDMVSCDDEPAAAAAAAAAERVSMSSAWRACKKARWLDSGSQAFRAD